MTFEAFVDAVDERVRAETAVEYGLYRGPFVAFWHLHDVSIRLRAGANDDVELEVTGAGGARSIEPCTTAAVPVCATQIARALGAALQTRS